MTTRSIEVRRTFAASRERVFAAWCRPELMAQWFFPSAGWHTDVTADVRPQGRYRIAMHDPGGGVHLHDGVYQVIEPVSRLVLSWNAPALGVRDSVVTIELHARGEHTELVLTHTLPDDAPVRRAHHDGWTGCLGCLATFLSI